MDADVGLYGDVTYEEMCGWSMPAWSVGVSAAYQVVYSVDGETVSEECHSYTEARLRVAVLARQGITATVVEVKR